MDVTGTNSSASSVSSGAVAGAGPAAARRAGSIGSSTSSLLTKTITSKRRSKRERQQEQRQQQNQQHQHQHQHHLHLHHLHTSGDGSGDARSRAQISLVGGIDGDRSGASQSAMAAEEESAKPAADASEADFNSRKPAAAAGLLSKTASHSTTSSPHAAPGQVPDIRAPDLEDSDRSSRASTYPPESSNSADPAASALPSSKTGLAPPKQKSRRSVSPAGRFRDVFRSKKSPPTSLKSTASSSQSPERKSHQQEQQPPQQQLFDTDLVQTKTKADLPPPPSLTVTDVSETPNALPTLPPAAVVTGDQPPSSSNTARPYSLDTSRRPETPTNTDSGPIIVNTPPTPTDHSHPHTLSHHTRSPSTPEFGTPGAAAAAAAAATHHLHHAHGHSPLSTSSSSSSMTSPRRARAGTASLGPSKLSNFSSAPLSPTPENAPSTPSTGFFSSVVSVAQNATSSLSNTITGTNISAPWNSSGKKTNNNTSSTNGGSLSRDLDNDSQAPGSADDRVEVESGPGQSQDPASFSEPKELAVNTLGMGDLSLSQLGIVDPPKNTASAGPPVPGITPSPTMPTQLKVAEITNESRHRSESAPADSPYHISNPGFDQHAVDDFGLPVGRAPSVADTTVVHDTGTPSATSLNEDRLDHVQRTGSVRSALDRRRKRGSSAATGGTSSAMTIAAAIAAANASVAHPAHSSTPKLTGFAVASKKRNRDFHNLFKSVPDDDYLIEDYSCALQREILAHGRLYVSEGHLCFSSNIMGWSTTLVMSFDEIVSVEKRSTALIFKNGLMISTLHAKHIFASFASRDSTYDLIVKIWKLGHPSLQSSLNGVHIDETGGDKTEKIGAGEDLSIASRSDSASETESDDSEDVYDEDAEDDDVHDISLAADGGGAIADTDGEKSVMRKPSGLPAVATNGATADKPKGDAPASLPGEEFPGPQTHAPTDCGDTAQHFDKFLADETIPAPLGKTFSYVFGAVSVSFMPKWLAGEQNKCFDIQMSDKKGLGPDNRSRTYTYVKPLFGAIGPKQTKCTTVEQIESIDFDKAVTVVCSTQTPDVPNGNVFVVKTRYCLSWGENNTTRLQANCTIEWSGKSWIKGAIEKGANDGQGVYCRELVASLREALLARPRTNTLSNVAGKGKKKGRKSKTTPTTGPSSHEGPAKPSAKSDWGPLEPLHAILGPAVDLVRPLLTGNVMYGLLVGLLVATWFGFGFTTRQPQRGFGQELGYAGYAGSAGFPDRVAAYDEMWRREESELWSWLEERVGLDRLGNSEPPHRKKVIEPRTVEEKLREERMDDREIREAIKVTEEKLKVLKSVVESRDEL